VILQMCGPTWNTPLIDLYESLGAVAHDDWTVYRVIDESLVALAES